MTTEEFNRHAAERRPAAYVCTCSAEQRHRVGCDCGADRFKVIDVDMRRLDSGLFALTFDGKIRGDAAKFSRREAYQAAAAWDGKESGEWKGSEWVPTVYRCAWGAKRASGTI